MSNCLRNLYSGWLKYSDDFAIHRLLFKSLIKLIYDYVICIIHVSNNILLISVLSDRIIVSQCVLFLIAGYDTTASLLAFSSYLLAKYPEEQRRLREEIQAMIQEQGDITYQGIMEAKFLDACIMGEDALLYSQGWKTWYHEGEGLCLIDIRVIT